MNYASRSGELKFHDVDLDDAVVGAGVNVTATVNIIPQGVTEVQRVGRKCTLKSLWWRYQVTLPTQDAIGVPISGDTLRIILYLDKQANGATALNTDVLESTDVHSFRNLANSGRFVFLCDKLHTLNYRAMASDGAGVVSQGKVVQDFVFYKNMNIPIEFNGATGAIAEIRSNNIGVILASNLGIIGFNSKIRLRFSDQ